MIRSKHVSLKQFTGRSLNEINEISDLAKALASVDIVVAKNAADALIKLMQRVRLRFAVIAAGAMPDLVGSLINSNSAVIEHVVRIIANLAQDTAAKLAITVRATPYLVSALSNANVVVVRNAVRTFASLTIDAVLRPGIIAAGAVAYLVAALENSDVAVVRNAMRALANLVQNQLAIPDIINVRAISRINSALTNSDVAVSRNAVRALVTLSLDERAIPALINEGAIVRMNEALASSDLWVTQRAALALVNLTRAPQHIITPDVYQIIISSIRNFLHNGETSENVESKFLIYSRLVEMDPVLLNKPLLASEIDQRLLLPAPVDISDINTYENRLEQVNHILLEHGLDRVEFNSDSVCPITAEAMKAPVLDPLQKYQHTYEYSAVLYWINDCLKRRTLPTCPLTRKLLFSQNLRRNVRLEIETTEQLERQEIRAKEIIENKIYRISALKE